MSLKPTLWRSCRVLANQRRLKLLGELLHAPGQTVTALAVATGIPLDKASRYLRDLNARGLLKTRRISRFVMYYPEADSSVDSAAPLLAALSKTVSRNIGAIMRTRRVVTAFTHPRRIEIVGLLLRGPRGLGDLIRLTRISRPAFMRHLHKLAKRGFVRRVNAGVWECVRQTKPLERCLVKLVAGDMGG